MHCKNVLMGLSALGIVTFVGGAAVFGQTTRTWNGGGSVDNWNDPLNWGGSSALDPHVPDMDNEIAIFTADVTVTFDTDIRIGQLVLSNSGTDVVIISNASTAYDYELTIADGSLTNGQLTVPSGTTITFDDKMEVILEDAVTHPIGGTVNLATAS